MLLKKVAALIDQQPRTNSYHSTIIHSLQWKMSLVILENCSSFQVAYSNKNKKVCVWEREGGRERESSYARLSAVYKETHTSKNKKKCVCVHVRERERNVVTRLTTQIKTNLLHKSTQYNAQVHHAFLKHPLFHGWKQAWKINSRILY